ncbi:NAD-dependent epimerase/dehydratase family protein [Streptomyces sp. NRRL F-5053]|uniref:NAD-dependent epimerase/dehydratase family protein n=1 Tax=Streptomyces sp. NRRL F-5053 TaxID=1463854 RepID=UPI0004C5FE2E|nr:NAD-dependent epimerase/dehydratase family protein [Streptomyces sp. NRRL F-5053]
MEILVLGGTWFLGRAVADGAMQRGWNVTVFNRGKSGMAPEGARSVHGDRTVSTDLLRLAQQGPWDAVIDTSASDLAPRDVLAGSRALEPAADKYIFISTVNAYRGWPEEPLSESSELLDGPPDADNDYGRLPDPGDPAQSIQPIDVRDVAEFALDHAATRMPGAFNVVAPIGHDTMSGLLSACVEVTGRRGHLTWAPGDLLTAHQVKQWTELPLWRTHAGTWSIDSAKAQAAGLRCRPLAETVAATWRWLEAGGAPVAHPRWDEHGISPAKEAAILAALSA